MTGSRVSSPSKSALENKVALIVGGAQPLGRAIASKFADAGAKLLIVGLPGDPVPEVVDELSESGSRVEGFIADVAVESQAEDCVGACLESFGQIDILINASSSRLDLFSTVATEHIRVSDFDRELYASLRAVFLMTRFALPFLRKTKGVVLSAGTEMDGVGLMMNPVHGANREWVTAFMKGIAAEYAKVGIRANTVSLGPLESDWPEENSSLESPMGRLGRLEEIAAVFTFLASSEAGFVTGANFVADGGLSVAPVSSRPIPSPELNDQTPLVDHPV